MKFYVIYANSLIYKLPKIVDERKEKVEKILERLCDHKSGRILWGIANFLY